MSNFSYIVGTWHLKQFTVTDKNGETNEWRNGSGQGLLIYSNDGYMSVSINADPRNLKNSAEANDILDRCLFYAGTFEIAGKTIKHNVQFATGGQRIGQDMVRDYKLEENKLIMSGQGVYGSSVLVWERER